MSVIDTDATCELVVQTIEFMDEIITLKVGYLAQLNAKDPFAFSELVGRRHYLIKGYVQEEIERLCSVHINLHAILNSLIQIQNEND